jgi:ABC-type transport system substrate-binding protein
MEWARKPAATGPYKVREFHPDRELILDAHEEKDVAHLLNPPAWGGRSPNPYELVFPINTGRVKSNRFRIATAF